MKNILIIKLRYLGDVLLATPVLQTLRERIPGARLTMAVNAGTEAVVKGNPHLDDVIVVDRRGIGAQLELMRRLRSLKFDCVIDLTDGDRSAILTWATRAPVRVGLNDEHRWRGLVYTVIGRHRAESHHRLEQQLDTLRVLGIEPILHPPVLRISELDDRQAAALLEGIEGVERGASPARPLVMLQPGARYWFKAWPPERYAALADRLAERLDCRVLVGGDPGERQLAESIRAQARSAPTVVAGRTSILQHAGLLKRCALFVGNDNGPMHMAAALGTPVVGLFGPSNPAEWGPRGAPSEVLYKGLDCRRCFHPTCERGEQSCMRLISIDEVYAAAERLLGRSREVRGARFEVQEQNRTENVAPRLVNVERRTSN